jgi:hypothetical protein
MITVPVRPHPFRQLQPIALGITVLLSLGGLSFALLEGWPLWATGFTVLLPWMPIFARDVARMYRTYQWLALFYVLVVTQTGHFLEHVTQMIQIHVLGLQGPAARGVFGTLDIEWVHFVWNTWVLIAVVVLLAHYRSNRWLWLAAFLSTWHEVEHVYIFSTYLATGVSGTAGLLAQGGAILGGLPMSRPDLHFVYNLIETVPLIVAFLRQAQAAGQQAWRPRRIVALRNSGPIV